MCISPNGDSSSTQSRQSPAKLQSNKSSDLLTKTLNKTRGHSRELSEISVGSDDANVEIEKLLKRIQEMTEILEARESKLVDVSRINMELHERNESLRRQAINYYMNYYLSCLHTPVSLDSSFSSFHLPTPPPFADY